MSRVHGILGLVLVLLGASPAAAVFDSASFNAGQGPLTITRITPSGEDVPPGRQIVLHFNRPVVPVGRMERAASEIPISIAPPLACEWRWLNTSALACQLGEQQALRPATHYRLTIRPGISAEDGATLGETVIHSFTTERPKVRGTHFITWTGPGTPVIRVSFNQPVVRASLAPRLSFIAGGQVRAAAVEPDLEAERFSEVKGRLWRVRPEAELPLDTAAELRVAPGILPLGGGEGSVEARPLVSFRTFPEFALLGVECRTNAGQTILVAPGDKPDPARLCNPLDGAELVFSAPVFPSQLRAHLTVLPDLAGGRTDYDPWEGYGDWSRLSYPASEHRYGIRLPESLKAYEPYLLRAEAGSIADEFGRTLAAPLRLMFFTDHRKPDVSFDHQQAVLEKGEQSEVPLVVTNLKSLIFDATTLTAAGSGNARRRVELPVAQDIAWRTPLGVRTLLGAPSGVVYGTFQTDPVVYADPESRTFFAQVTPWGVQAKVGHHNTLVWITDLASGAPVPGVTVELYRDLYPGLTDRAPVLAAGVSGADGTLLLPGTAALDPQLQTFDWNRTRPKLFVRCRLGEDFALLPLSPDFEARYQEEDGSYVWSEQQKRHGHLRAWGTTAQGIYRAGDTIDYKLYVRDQENRTFGPAPRTGYTLEVSDPMGRSVHRVEALTLNEFGAFHGSFTVPKNGAVGWYRFTLGADFREGVLEPLQVLVSDFTPAPFKAGCDLSGGRFRPGETLQVTTSARLHAGGPYADAPARVTVQLAPRRFVAADPGLRDFVFDSFRAYAGPRTLHQSEAAVDAQGDLITPFLLPESDVVFGQLQVESAVRDDRGKFVVASARADFIGRDRLVGLRQDDWLLRQEQPAALQVVVVDDAGRPATGTAVTLKVEYRRTVASRVKGAGSAYLTRFEHLWEEVATTSLSSSTAPLPWQFTPAEPGLYRVTASISDTRGRAHSTLCERWATGKGSVVWPTEEGHGLSLLPEKETFRVGERARFLVQNPYPGVQALVTVERFGVLRQWVTTLAEATAVVEVEIEPDFVPGFYLSVTLAAPRVDRPLGDDQVDLGKPTFRMGYLRVPVNDPVKELAIKVDVDREIFKPRETVSVTLQAARRDGGAQLPPVEYAVAVLDEAVLDLVQNGTGNWDVYRGFYSLDTLDVANYHLLMRLVGRQKFEKKGANAGGDGGPDLALRTLFRFVGYWNPALKADPSGKASFSFEVPDNLTGWRVLALAVTPGDRMGLGQGSFKVNRPTELRPALPNQVIEGDRFRAGFTVMNRTDQPRTLSVELKAAGALAAPATLRTEVQAPPWQRVALWLPVATRGSGEVTFTARAWDRSDGDALKETLEVRPWSVLETAASYGTTTAARVAERIAFPAGIRTDVGSIGVTAAPSVVGNLAGAFAYMRDYPYLCWEQQLSKGVMASHYRQLRPLLPADLEWPGAAELPGRTLALAAEHQAPGGGMAYYVPRDEYVSPYLSAYTALAFNWLRAAGESVPAEVEQRLHGYLANLLRQEAFPTFYSPGMSSTVRAVALAALAPHGKLTRADLERYRPHLAQMSLFGKAHYLLAALRVAGAEELRAEVANMILAQANETGGKYVFQESLDSGFAQLLTSTLRDNGAVLSALLAYSETPQGAQLGEIPFKLVRTLTQSRGQRDRWHNTQENLFCLNALIEYRRLYEAAPPQLKLTASLGGETLGTTSFKAFSDPPVTLARPLAAADPGRSVELELNKEGAGRVYYGVRLAFAPATARRDPVNAGIEVRRELSVQRDGRWQLLTSPLAVKRGELVRVDLFVSLPAARNFVVVDDPVPGGLEPVNRDLATASGVDADQAGGGYAGGSFWHSRNDWHEYGYSYWSFYHRELRHFAARFYSEYLPAGNYHLAYVAQAIAPGEFTVMPTKAEEMYDPDVYGLGEPALLRVEE